MIIFITSMVLPFPALSGEAHQVMNRLDAEGKTNQRFFLPGHLNQKQEKEEADRILKLHQENPEKVWVVCSFHETFILRLLRQVRDGILKPEELECRDVHESGVDVPRITDGGDFLDPWRHHFFDGRIEEVF